MSLLYVSDAQDWIVEEADDAFPWPFWSFFWFVVESF